MKIGAAFSPQLKDATLDWDAIATAIEQGEVGKIVEVEDEAEHKAMEVWVEPARRGGSPDPPLTRGDFRL
jgi:hypothetical protein